MAVSGGRRRASILSRPDSTVAGIPTFSRTAAAVSPSVSVPTIPSVSHNVATGAVTPPTRTATEAAANVNVIAAKFARPK